MNTDADTDTATAAPMSPTRLQLYQAVEQAKGDIERERPLAVAREPGYMTCWGPDAGLHKAHAPVRRAMQRLERATKALKAHDRDTQGGADAL